MSKPKTEVDIEVINRVREAHIAALNSGNVEAWVALFTDDGVQMPPNAPANVGQEMIRSWSQAFLDTFRTEFRLLVDEVRLTDDWAFERGTYTITLTLKAGGELLHDVGKYITIYQRQAEGTWGVARDIWNSNNPLPAMQ